MSETLINTEQNFTSITGFLLGEFKYITKTVKKKLKN
jgi:hypothetical protein